MTKRACVVLLIGINLALLSALGLLTWDLPKANAQAAPMASNFVMVAAEISEHHDGLFVIDLSSRMLHAFDVDRTSKQILPRDSRDLRLDFRGPADRR